MDAEWVPCYLEQSFWFDALIWYHKLSSPWFSTNISHYLFLIQCSSQKPLHNTDFLKNVHRSLWVDQELWRQWTQLDKGKVGQHVSLLVENIQDVYSLILFNLFHCRVFRIHWVGGNRKKKLIFSSILLLKFYCCHSNQIS